MNSLVQMLVSEEGKQMTFLLLSILMLIAILTIPTMILIEVFQSRNKAYAR